MKILAFITSALILSGCAAIPFTHDQCNATKFPTAMEHEQCLLAASKYEQAQYEQENSRLIRRDKLIIWLNACDVRKDLIVLEVLHVGRTSLPNQRAKEKSRERYGYAYTHMNVSRKARRNDFMCIDRNDFRDLFPRAMMELTP